MTGSQPLDERYGTARTRGFDRRFAWAAGALLVIGGVLYLVFGGWQQGTSVSYQDIGRDLVSEQRVDVRFDVTAPAQTPVVCAVQALSDSKATVGWKIVELPVTEERTHRVSTSIATTGPATTGSVRDCWVPESD